MSKIALHKNKKSSSFLSVFDGLLSEEWASRIYKYALEYQRPWGKSLVCGNNIILTLAASDRNLYYQRRCHQRQFKDRRFIFHEP